MEGELIKAGLTRNEAKAYLELLKQGELSANKLSKKISMDRSLTYTILNNLIEKGLVSYIKKDTRKYFKPEHPKNLLNPIKSKELFIETLINNLIKIKPKKDEETEIKIFEGKAGIRNFINLAIKEKYFYAFGSTGLAFFSLHEMPHIAKKVSKLKKDIKIIGNKKYKGTEPFEFKAFKYKYLDIKSKATTSIFGDYVSIHLLTQKPLIILINNKEIAESYRNHFKVLWKVAKG
ncbi:MAG: hypothetical protein KKF68_02645 [Nanoarchaeota archaeon]|nr:hypothetical protein [Nanoarchaeota archaeon]